MSPSFEGARDTTIQQLTQIEKQINTILMMAIMVSKMHSSSFQDSVDQPKCHPGTREKIQSELVGWATSSNIREEKVLWIYAPAEGNMNGTLLGFFAFSRHSNERNTAERLFPSLAYQLARCVPIARQMISKAIAQDPHIFAETRIEAQLRSCCMIIDGLDECQNPRSQSLIIQSIVKIVSRTSVPLRFLIFSRSEPEIRSTFKRRDVSRYCVPLELDGRFTPDKDIELYLNEKFEEIKTRKWPNKEDILTLVRQSSGQFIYPATVMRYITDERNAACPNDNPYAELDALYRLILESAEASYEDISHIFIVLRSSPIPCIEDDVRIHLTDLHSIINDFLAKESRSGPFFIEESHSNGYIANLDIYEKQRYQHYFFKHLLKGNSEWVDNITNTFGPNSIIRIMRRSIQESWWKYAVMIGSSVPAITLGENLMSNMLNFMNYWLIRFYDDDTCFPRAKWLDDGLSGDIPKILVKWVIDKKACKTLPIELYYHIFRLLFVKEHYQALKRFKLVQWRMNKLQMCLDDFLKKCKSKSFADYQSNE
ncbi:hypothetical protein BDQ17DRAFT_1362367 [Cyathus striatus]|nr:hypothetical protein BDQ17DRAFT_1362367 [Cyathus striatus]